MAKYKVKKVERDGDGNVTKEEAVDVHAVCTDKVNKTTEALDTDEIEIIRFYHDRIGGIVKIHVMIGGRDSKGDFHANKEYQEAAITFSREGNAILWEALDLETKTKIDYDKIKQFLHNKEGAKKLGSNYWKIENLESTYEP